MLFFLCNSLSLYTCSRERREQELHELYCQASTPEEKAAILQRYALRFTISDTILEKLQLPKLPSVTALQSAHTLNEEAEILEVQAFTELETDSSDRYLKQITHTIMHSHLHTPDLSPLQDSKTQEVTVPKIPISPVPDSNTTQAQPVPDSDPKASEIRDTKALEAELSPVSDPKASKVQLSPVRDSNTPDFQPSPVSVSKASVVQPSEAQESNTPEVQLSPLRNSNTPQVQRPPLRDINTPEVQSASVQEFKASKVQLFPVQDSSTPEVLLSLVQESKTPDIALSPFSDPKPLEANLSPNKTTKTPEVPVSPVWIPPAPSRPVPLLTAKPYCQPKFNQPSYKQVKVKKHFKI